MISRRDRLLLIRDLATSKKPPTRRRGRRKLVLEEVPVPDDGAPNLPDHEDLADAAAQILAPASEGAWRARRAYD